VLANSIYIITDGTKDLSRWLEITCHGDSHVTLQLSELCQPGRPSSLKSATCPLPLLRRVTDLGGTVQITTSGGYLLVWAEGNLFNMDFRGHDDAQHTRCALNRDEVSERLTVAEKSELGLVGR
jgi:hypothetical protein